MSGSCPVNCVPVEGADEGAAVNLAAFTAYPTVSGLVIDVSIAHTNTGASTRISTPRREANLWSGIAGAARRRTRRISVLRRCIHGQLGERRLDPDGVCERLATDRPNYRRSARPALRWCQRYFQVHVEFDDDCVCDDPLFERVCRRRLWRRLCRWLDNDFCVHREYRRCSVSWHHDYRVATR